MSRASISVIAALVLVLVLSGACNPGRVSDWPPPAPEEEIALIREWLDEDLANLSITEPGLTQACEYVAAQEWPAPPDYGGYRLDAIWHEPPDAIYAPLDRIWGHAMWFSSGMLSTERLTRFDEEWNTEAWEAFLYWVEAASYKPAEWWLYSGDLSRSDINFLADAAVARSVQMVERVCKTYTN